MLVQLVVNSVRQIRREAEVVNMLGTILLSPSPRRARQKREIPPKFQRLPAHRPTPCTHTLVALALVLKRRIDHWIVPCTRLSRPLSSPLQRMRSELTPFRTLLRNPVRPLKTPSDLTWASTHLLRPDAPIQTRNIHTVGIYHGRNRSAGKDS